MKKNCIVLLMFISANALAGTSEVAIQGSSSWLKIEGDSAKALYDALQVTVKKSPGETGPGMIFKVGKSYRCFTDLRTETYVCDFMIQNPETGELK